MTRLPLTLRLLCRFLALVVVCLAGHDAVRLLAERLGASAVAAELAAGVFTLALIWGGRALICYGQPLAGVTLIAANLPLQLLLLSPAYAPPIAALLLWPPLWASHRALAYRPAGRRAVLAALLLLPPLWALGVTHLVLTPLARSFEWRLWGIDPVHLAAALAALGVLFALRRRRPSAEQSAFAMISGQVFAVSGGWRAARRR